MRENFSMEEYKRVKAQYKALKRVAFETEYRKKDDILQKQKGQPLLDDEETGVKWHNDATESS